MSDPKAIPQIEFTGKSKNTDGTNTNDTWSMFIFNNEPRFNGVFSRDNLPRIKDGVYVVNLDDK